MECNSALIQHLCSVKAHAARVCRGKVDEIAKPQV